VRLVPLLFLSLDNTLLDRAGAFIAWGKGFLADIGAPESDIHWLTSTDADGLVSRWDLADAMRQRYRLPVTAVDIVAAIREGILAHLRLDPMVAFALRIAEDSGWVPVVVTNGAALDQEAKVRRSGLDKCVADWVISEEVGVRKPNPRIFQIAADRVRMRPDGAWLVGDSPEVDIGGADAIGVPSVWIHRGRQWLEPRFRPTRIADGAIAALAEVLMPRR
jgi:putative hydrolase of the HAD superfamily